MPSKEEVPLQHGHIRLENGQTRPMTETEQIQQQIELATGETLDSTRRMLALCEEAKESGLQTLVMLDDQGEQLDRIEEGLEKINQDMKDAEKNLDDLNKCCGLCVLPWNKSKPFDKGGDYEKAWKKSEDGKVNAEGPRVIIDQSGGGPAGSYITRITNDAQEEEMDNNIQEVANMVGNLRNMAVDMGSEINNQNQMIGRIVYKATSNQERIKTANEQANKLLK